MEVKPLKNDPGVAAATKKLAEFEREVARLEKELGQARAAAVPPRDPTDWDDLAELFAEAEAHAVALAQRPATDVERELSRFRRACELQQGILDDETHRAVSAACKSLEGEFASLAVRVADKLVEAHVLAQSAVAIYDKLVAAGARRHGIHFEQDSIQTADFLARNLVGLDISNPSNSQLRAYISRLDLPAKHQARTLAAQGAVYTAPIARFGG